MTKIGTLLKPILDFALPARCPVCGITVDDDHKFCTDCWQQLDFLSEPFCASCGIPFAFERGPDALCAACLDHPPPHQGVRAAVAYNDTSRQVALRLKYAGRLGLADLIAKHLIRYLPRDPDNYVLVPVPLHRRRIWSRGFNQSALIAQSLGKYGKIAVISDALLRVKATPPLRSLSEKKRRQLMTNAFALSSKAAPLITGKSILLVDDVYTTGATAHACCDILNRAGVSDIQVFCWARVLHDTIS